MLQHHSPNFSFREGKIQYIILHYTELDLADAISRLCNPKYEVSSHYLIEKNGKIHQLVKEQHSAWHAGVSYWRGLEALNHHSIGIEIDNLGNEPFSIDTMLACVKLCKKLIKKYKIPAQNIIGHSDIAPNRKIDPGVFFDWSFLSKYKIGMWHDINIKNPCNILYNYDDQHHDILLIQSKLQKLGYNVELSSKFDKQTNYVIRAFQAHFNPNVILERGHAFYWDNNSIYSWDQNSDLILNSLIAKASYD